MTRSGLVSAGLAAASGAAIFAAQPPLGWWPLAFAAPALLLEAVRRHDGRVWWLGLVAGMAAYLPMISWLVMPAGVAAWMLLSLIQSLFLVATALVVRPVVASGYVVLVAPIAWTGFDAWRNLVPLGGFGWGSLAYAHVEGSWMLPVARVLGQHGLTLLTVLISALVFDIGRRLGTADRTKRMARSGFPGLQPSFAGLVAALLASVAVTVEPPATVGTVDALVVQGNDRLTASSLDPDEDVRIAANMLALTRQAVSEAGRPELTVWPESSIDRDPYTGSGPRLLPIVEAAGGLAGGGLLAGTNLDGPRPRTFHNAAVLLGEDGRPVDRYVKRHLVPFGEYVPWRSLIGRLEAFEQVPFDAVAGAGPQTIELGQVRLAPLICFETLFPSLARDNVRADDAGVIVATTNDATFGRSSEPAQHLAQSRLRAVETGRWVIHAALSGSSAFVDPDGGVHDPTGLFELATIRREVPLVSGSTPFLTTGDLIGLGARLAVLLIAVAVIAAALRERRSTSEST